jgi:hypothetical protein
VLQVPAGYLLHITRIIKLTLAHTQEKRATLIYQALGRPEVSISASGVMRIGEFVINHNQFPMLRPVPVTVVETIPVETQIRWYEELVGSAEELVYFAHSERCDNRRFRPCAAICARYSMPMAWEIAAFSRDPGNIGQMVAAFTMHLSPDQLHTIATLASDVASKRPVCERIAVCLSAAGIGDEKPSDADIICAFVVAVGSYAGHFAREYLQGCPPSTEAIRILAQACPPLLPLSLGLLSPHLSQQL